MFTCSADSIALISRHPLQQLKLTFKLPELLSLVDRLQECNNQAGRWSMPRKAQVLTRPVVGVSTRQRPGNSLNEETSHEEILADHPWDRLVPGALAASRAVPTVHSGGLGPC